MRAWVVAALVGLLATSALAQNATDGTAGFRERLNTCVGAWNQTPASERGTMTYRQYTTKCLSGKTALPVKASALCRNGVAQPATAPEGACAFSGGIAEWLN